MFGQESLLPGISNQLALGGIVIAIALYTLYHVCVFPSAYPIDADSTQISTATDIPYIKGIPEIPGALPVTGHLLQLGDDHATICESWWRKYGTSVFQIRLGNTRAVVVNSFDDAKRMLIGHQSAVIDRPTLYTFHGIISSTKGFTIGSSPWDESCKNKRKAAGQALGRPKLKDYFDMFDLESYCIVRDLVRDSNNGATEISVRPYIQRYALNTTLTLCYGIRMDHVYDSMLREILEVGSAISLLRSASENYQDYIPILRYLPNNEKNRRSRELRDRRDKYLNGLLDQVREMIKNGTDKPCISAAILKDQETKLTGVEVSSICLSLVSGGFETIPGTLTSCIGSLSTPEGQIFQEKAYKDIKRFYPDVRDAWRNSFQDEKVPYVNAIIKEAARYYTVSAMSLPRKTVSEVVWDGAKIPAKTMILINAQAANHGMHRSLASATTFADSYQTSITLVLTLLPLILSNGSLLTVQSTRLLRKSAQEFSTSRSVLDLGLAQANSLPHAFCIQRWFALFAATGSRRAKSNPQIQTTWITTNLSQLS
jgi:phenylacetate 2-hydroxylase